MYKTLKEVTQTATQLNMTIGAFNTHNLEMMPEMIRAAKELSFKQALLRQNISDIK